MYSCSSELRGEGEGCRTERVCAWLECGRLAAPVLSVPDRPFHCVEAQVASQIHNCYAGDNAAQPVTARGSVSTN